MIYCIDQGGGKSSVYITEDVAPTLATTHYGEPVICFDMNNTVYMKVTADKYELPVAVADTPDGLARMTGATKATILSYISHSKNGKHRSVYKRVIISDKD